jgi:hypothetical protein
MCTNNSKKEETTQLYKASGKTMLNIIPRWSSMDSSTRDNLISILTSGFTLEYLHIRRFL